MTAVPAFVVAGLRSGVGKTTVTLGLIRALADRNLAVAAFKVGPDFLDPSHYKSAGAVSSRNIDPILQGSAGMMRAFSSGLNGQVERGAAVIEGVMGLFDGPIPGTITASTAEVAGKLGLPVLLVCDARSCAQSIAAEIIGARKLLNGTPLLGVLLNFVGSARHADLLTRGIQKLAKTNVLGCIFRDSLQPIPSRHLGLISAIELKIAPYAEYGKLLAGAVDIDRLLQTAKRLCKTPPPLWGRQGGGKSLPAALHHPPLKNELTVGIAFDEAFSFYYPESIEFFQRHAKVVLFSPLKDRTVPDAGLFYFGGGFPEIYARRLSANLPFRVALREKLKGGAKAYAECGGLMYLAKSIITTDGMEHPMTGHLPGACVMHKTRQALGYWKASVRQHSLFLKKNETLIGHEYHWSSYVPAGLKTVYRAVKVGAVDANEGGWIAQNAYASYLHLSPLGNPKFFRRLVDWAAKR